MSSVLIEEHKEEHYLVRTEAPVSVTLPMPEEMASVLRLPLAM